MNDMSTPIVSANGSSWERSALEKILQSHLAEQKARRMWRWIKLALWAGLLALLFWGVSTENAAKNAAAKTGVMHTAMVKIDGEIAPDNEASAENLLPGLRKAFETQTAKAVVLYINSPGGSPVQAGIINDEILRLKKLHKKKVIAVVDEMCASAAYYIAAAADEIYVDKASIVGSIGVLVDSFGFTGTMEKLGVERRLLTAGENKGILDPFSPLSETHRAHVQTMLNQIHQQFIQVVRTGRGARLKETPETFSGLFWTGEQAVQQGLADQFGNMDYVARDVLKAEEIVDYTPQENVAERLAKKFGAAVGEGAFRAAKASSVKLQ